MTAEAPLVSIGLPTYNGERHIREALDSLVGQDYPNLEIIIADNASTDGTFAIVQSYAARDARIRVIRHDVNRGAPENFNFVFRESRGPFFMWAADDDRWEPGYVRTCLNALLASPWAVLAGTRVRFIDQDGDPVNLDPLLYDNPDLSSTSIRQRVLTLLSRGAWYQIYGLMRRDVLALTRLHTDSYGADVVLLVELALLGPFALVDEILHVYRVFEVRTEPDRGALHGAVSNSQRVFAAPNTYLQEACSEAIRASTLRPADKLRAWFGMVTAVYVRRTPLRQRIAAETRLRLRNALRERDFAGVAKYGFLGSAIATRRLFRRLRLS